MTILITGGAGFIGANFVLDWLAQSDETVINLDKLTYAGNLETLASLAGNARHNFVQGDIADGALVASLLAAHRPRAVLNFAAESHVDRSIHGPEDFIQTNVVGTFRLLEAVRAYWSELSADAKADFRFLHVSTDEVYGSLAKDAPAFNEDHRYEPNSPYSASKAAVIGLTKSLGKELADTGICVNCVTPAAVKTAILDQNSAEHIAYMLSKIPMGRFGTPEEIAAMVAWLCTEECSFTTGAVFDLSGGRATY